MMTIPWFAYIYLFIYGLLAIAGCFDNYRSRYKLWQQIIAILSSIFVVIYVVGFFHYRFGFTLRWFIIPMLLVGISWEFHEISTDLRLINNNKEISPSERGAIYYLTLVITNIIIIPGYLAGIGLVYRIFHE